MARLVKSEQTAARARNLRAELTDPERLLWGILRDRCLAGAKFRRQAPLGEYVVDFVCFDAMLVVELDGVEHARTEQAEFDKARTRYLEAAGFRVLRIWNSQLYTDREAVLTSIVYAIRGTSLPDPPR